MFVIGTAGHVDHGKSSLVRALTGIDPDRLPEEKVREMTIDLGFAWLALPDGNEVGIVDVPGHERFIKNMIAGAGAVNAVLFVVAADDGWMPQSQEHLDILSLLRIQQGILVLTKVDLVDPDWVEITEQDIRKKTAGTFLESAPLVKVSSLKGTGIEELKIEISQMLGRMEPPKDIGKPHLYIDRVFTIAGRGTVITGTLASGRLSLNQEVEILPRGIKSRIREIQTHKKTLNHILPGNRAALNLSGIDKEELKRGDLIQNPHQDEPAEVIYINLHLLSHIKWSFKKQILLQVMLGSAEVLGRASLLEGKELQAGEEGLVEIRLKEALVPRLGDRVILRLPGPQMTVGGGAILDWSISTISKDKKSLLQFLDRRRELKLPELILSELENRGTVKSLELLKSSHFSEAEIEAETEKLLHSGQIARTGEVLYRADTIQKLREDVLKELKTYHSQYPHKPGLKAQEIGSKLGMNTEVLQLLVDSLLADGELAHRQGYLALSSHQPQLPQNLKNKEAALWKKLEASGFSPPSREELIKEDSDYTLIITYLIQMGRLVELRDGLLFTFADFQSIQEQIKELIARKEKVSVADVREKLSTSRKYAVPILEKLDQLGITRRKGDYRVLNEG